MRRLLLFFSAVSSIAIGDLVAAQDVQSIMQTMREKELARREGVDTYLVDQSLMGNRVQVVFARTVVNDPDGDAFEIFRQLAPDEDPCNAIAEGEQGNMTPEQLEQMAAAHEMTGQALGDEIEGRMDEMGLPPGMLAGSGSDPWATFDPRVSMGANAAFLRGAADAKRQRELERSMPDTSMDELQRFAETAELVGTEDVNGRKAFHIRADDLNMTEKSDDEEFTINTTSMWIDAEEYVPLLMKIEGEATSDGESRPMTMEKRDLDYRRVPDSGMYQSYRQVMTIAGVMNAEQQAEMQQAQAEMADLEKQLEQMPAAQRDMIMSQMGPQMEMMEDMASGGGMNIETEIHGITVNHCEKGGADAVIANTMIGSTPSGGQSGAQGVDIAAAAAAMGTTGAMPAMPADEVDVLPYYVDEEGIGLLRFSEPDGRSFDYKLVISGLTTNPDRPREVIVGGMGPYTGPDISVYIGSLNMMNVPLDQLEIELYEEEPYRPVARFRPVVDPDKAEGMEECGSVSSSGACSK